MHALKYYQAFQAEFVTASVDTEGSASPLHLVDAMH